MISQVICAAGFKRQNGGLNMSQKELLYIEDALGHEQQMKTACTDFASQIQDPELRDFVMQLSARHGESFNRFYGLLR